jgi:subtilase family serine protease
MLFQRRTLVGFMLACACMLVSLVLGAGEAAAVPPPPCADVQVSGVVIKPTAPSQTQLISGQPAEIEVAVKNAGSCAAGGFVVRFMTAPNSFVVVSGSIAGLGAGASTSITLPYSFPKAGNFETEVQLNPKHEVPETNYANDIALKAITVVQANVKLVITGFSVASSDPTNAVVEGRPAIATITVENAGNVVAEPLNVQWTPFTFAATLTHSVAAGLEPGKTVTVQIAYTYKFHGTATGTAGVSLAGHLMPLVTRTLETVIEPPLANLRIVKVLPPNANFATRPSTQQVEIENDGNAAAGHFVVQWSPGPGQTMQSQQVNGLGEGATTTLTFTYVYPKPGTYEGLITLDPTKLIKELFTTEKTAKTLLVIPEGTVDLTVTGLSVEAVAGGSVVQETPTVAFVRVKNLGNIASPSFVTAFNPNSLGISGSGTTAVTEETASLEPGEERTIEFLFTYAKPGNYRAVAEVNPRRAVKESNYANNSKFVEVPVEPLPINLNFSTGIEVSSANFIVDGGKLFPGEEATASFTVENFGPIATGPFEVQFQSQTGGFKTTRFIEGLNPGESRLETFKVTYTKPGEYTMTAILDPTEAVDKTATGFKPIEETRTVTVEPIDLNFSSGIEVSSPEFNLHGVLFPNEAATATVDVFNNSPVKTPAFAVQFQSQAGGFKQTQFIAGLNAFEAKAVPFNVKYFKPGSYTMTAILDPFKAVDKKVNGVNPIEETRTVTVDEKTAAIKVEVPKIETTFAFPNHSWFMDLFAYEPSTAGHPVECFYKRETSKKEQIFKVIHNEAPAPGPEKLCPQSQHSFSGANETFNAGMQTEVHLKETMPLMASVHTEAYTVHKEKIGKKTIEFVTGASPGIASVTKSRKEYVELPANPFSQFVAGTGCRQPSGNEKPQECYQAFFTLTLQGHAGPAFAQMNPAHAVRGAAKASGGAAQAAIALQGAAEGTEPEGTLEEKQATADREAAEHEATEREAAERAAAQAEAVERANAAAAEAEAVLTMQEVDSQIAEEEAQAEREALERESGGTGE